MGVRFSLPNSVGRFFAADAYFGLTRLALRYVRSQGRRARFVRAVDSRSTPPKAGDYWLPLNRPA
jgi:hypothetical protein